VAITEEEFGRLAEGLVVPRYELVATDGLTVGLIPFGAIVTDVSVPTKDGHPVNIALGLPTLADYVERNEPCFGAVVGRFAGRIGGATFALDGTTYRLPANDGPNCLHGGPSGFGHRLWSVVAADDRQLALRYVSEDGEEGFPGELTTDLRISVEPGELRFEYRATCDRPTVVNLANHTYWNLAGDDSGTIDDHDLTVIADRVVPCDAEGIPTGDPVPVGGTPLDFRRETRLGDIARSSDRVIVDADGIDHTFILAGAPRDVPEHAATLVDPGSGRRLEVWTTEPALQVYTGNDLDGSLLGPSGVPYCRRAGVALETQHAPDSPNLPSYPSTVLRPGELFESTTVFRLFS
jgi:aldose 1-epimerase